MSKNLLAAAAAATVLATPALAWAEEAASPHTLTANVTLTSDYLFRGMTQTSGHPAIQGGFDYSYAFSGAPVTFYVGTWGSNASWWDDTNIGAVPPQGVRVPQSAAVSPVGTVGNSNSMEWDFYGGLKGAFGKSDFGYDVGLIYYYYPGDYDNITVFTYKKPNTTEAYGALSWKWLTFKASFGLGDDYFGLNDASGSYYLDLSASVPIGDTGLTVIGHVGHQKYKGRSDFLNAAINTPALGGFLATNPVFDNDVFSFTDWKLGLAYDLGKVSKVTSGMTLGAAWTSTDGKGTELDPLSGIVFPVWENAFGRNMGKSTGYVWLSKTF